MTTIGSFDARTHFSELLRRVENGRERFVLTVRGNPVAVLGPVPAESDAEQDLSELLGELREFRARVAARGGPVLRPGETWKGFARGGLAD